MRGSLEIHLMPKRFAAQARVGPASFQDKVDFSSAKVGELSRRRTNPDYSSTM